MDFINFQLGELTPYAQLPRIGSVNFPLSGTIDGDLKAEHDLEEAGNFCETGNCGELHTRYYGYFEGNADDKIGAGGTTGRAEGKVAAGSILGFNEPKDDSAQDDEEWLPPISDREVKQFAKLDLERLDDADYFRRHFG